MSVVNITLLTLFEILGDFQFRTFALTDSPNAFMGGIAGYVGVIYFLIASLRQGNVLWVNGMWDGISGVIESLAAFYILGDRFNHWWQYLGLFIVVAGLFIMRAGGISN